MAVQNKSAALSERWEMGAMNSIAQNLQHALDYLKIGWHPIPLCWPKKGKCACHKEHTNPKDIAKAPLLNSYSLLTKVTEANIREWWGRWPEANIGILQKPSKLVTIDPDSKEAIAEAESLGLPISPRDSTGTGQHIYYSRPEHARVARKIDKGESKDIDVLSAGYVIVAPSVHASGRSYEWLPSLSPGEVGLAEAPAWAVDILNEDTAVDAEPVKWSELIEINVDELNIHDTFKTFIKDGKAKGERSDAVFSVIRALVGAGCDVNTIASVLLDSNNGISEKPLEKGEAWTSAEIGRVMAKHKAEIVDDFDDVPGLGEDGKASKFQFIMIDDVINAKPPEWQIEGILVENSLGIVYAPPARFKSFLALSMALSTAYGLPWMGREVKQGGVLYVSAEGQGGMGKRIKAWMTHHGVSGGPGVPFYLYGSAVNLGIKAEVRGLIEAVPAGVRLIILDTLHRCMPGANENDSKDVGMFTNGCAKLQRELGVSIIIVHHAGKDISKGMRGSSSIESDVDTVIRLERKAGEDCITVKCGKQKEFEEFRAFTLQVQAVENSLILKPSFSEFEDEPDEPKLTKSEKNILNVLQDHKGGLSPKEIQDKAKVSTSTWKRTRKILLEEQKRIKFEAGKYFHILEQDYLE